MHNDMLNDSRIQALCNELRNDISNASMLVLLYTSAQYLEIARFFYLDHCLAIKETLPNNKMNKSIIIHANVNML